MLVYYHFDSDFFISPQETKKKKKISLIFNLDIF